MSKLGRAILISAAATATAAAVWGLVSRWQDRTVQVGPARSDAGLHVERSRDEEIEALTQQQKDLMLRELADHV